MRNCASGKFYFLFCFYFLDLVGVISLKVLNVLALFLPFFNIESSYGFISALKIEDDYIVIAGNYSGTADFDFGDGVENRNSPEGYNTFIQKLSTDGELTWVNSYESNSYFTNITGLVINIFKDIIVPGEYAHEMDFDHRVDTEIETTTSDLDGSINQVYATFNVKKC